MITKEMMKPLIAKRQKANVELMKVNKAIKALQNLCDHDWVSDGQDSHKDHYKCDICEKTESR